MSITLLSETPSGTINGSNKVFVATNAPSFVTVNGIVQSTNGTDATVVGLTITFVVAPTGGSVILSYYISQPSGASTISPTGSYLITMSQMKNDIVRMMKGTSIREVKDFYGTAAAAANRMLSRIDTDETRRTVTATTPFYDNVQDYALPSDYKRMIDIRPQANRTSMPGRSHFGETAPRQFNERLSPNSFSIRWNNMVRTIRAQQLPVGNVMQMDSFDSATGNGTWTAEGDASGLYQEILNYVEGNGSLGFADLVNTTATVTDMSQLRYNDSSVIAFWIPYGFCARFVNVAIRRGSSASNYREAVATTKIDGTAFTDGWNFIQFNWNSAAVVGSPDDTKNTYRRFGMTYTAGPAIPGILVDNWTDSIGQLYEFEYYSNFLFRTSTGGWISVPTTDTDLINVSQSSYEILKTEMMIDITKSIRTGAVQSSELADWRQMLNGQPQTRYVKDPPYHGLYADYAKMNPSSAIVTVTKTYDFDC